MTHLTRFTYEVRQKHSFKKEPRQVGSICISHKIAPTPRMRCTKCINTNVLCTDDKVHLQTKQSWSGRVSGSVVKQSRSTNLVLKQNCTPNSNYSGSYNNLKKLEKTTSKSPIFRFYLSLLDLRWVPESPKSLKI